MNQFSGSHDGPEIELSAPNQSELAAKEFMEGGGTRVEFALDSPFIELRAAEPPEISKLEGARGRENTSL